MTGNETNVTVSAVGVTSGAVSSTSDRSVVLGGELPGMMNSLLVGSESTPASSASARPVGALSLRMRFSPDVWLTACTTVCRWRTDGQAGASACSRALGAKSNASMTIVSLCMCSRRAVRARSGLDQIDGGCGEVLWVDDVVMCASSKFSVRAGPWWAQASRRGVRGVAVLFAGVCSSRSSA